MEGLGDVDVRSAQMNALKSSINYDIEPNTRQIPQMLQRRPLV
jgi:hypothetical protein